MQIVIFKINDEQFAIEASMVQGINDIMRITKVHKAPKHIKGLINLRGSIVSLLDINMLLNMEESKEKQNNIIILKLREEQVAIMVDQVDEVLAVKEDIVEKVEERKVASYHKGIINLKGRIVTLIDINKLLINY